MPLKPVLDIDINLEKWTAFSDAFDKFQKKLKESPAAWAKVSKENAAVSKQFEGMTAALLAQNSLTNDNAKAEHDREAYLKRSATHWNSIASAAKNTATSVLRIGEGLLKWGGILGAGLLGGSLFGLDRLGQNVSSARQSALGLGLTIGQKKSFETNLSRFVDPGSFLGGVNEAVTDVSKQGPLYSLGVNPRQSTSQVAIDTLQEIRKRVKDTPTALLGRLLDSYQLGSITNVNELQRIKGTGDREWNAQIARYGTDQNRFDITTAPKWQEFTTRLERSGEMIEKVFVDGLGRGNLLPAIERLSDAFVHMLERVMKKDGPLEKGVDTIAHWIDQFSGIVEKPEFLQKIDVFSGDLSDMADKFHDFWNTVKGVMDNPLDAAESAAGKALSWDFTKGQELRWAGLKQAWGWVKDKVSGGSAAFDLNKLARLDEKYGLPKNALETIYGKESDFGNAANGKSNPFGLTGDAAIGVNRNDWDQAAARAAEWYRKLLRNNNGDAVKALAAYNIGQGGVDAAVSRYGNDWQKHVPYVQKVTLVQPPGNNVQISASQLAVGQAN